MGRLGLPALGLMLLFGGLCAAASFAQAQSGNLYGEVTDTEGQALPGVKVTLLDGIAPQVWITNDLGEFRFLGLPLGSYLLRAELDGFFTVELPNIVIGAGRNTTLEVQLESGVEETITMTAESPLLDSRRITTGTTVGQVELEKIPSARDPWAVLQTVPGVLTDRVNESGRPSRYTGPGSRGDNAVWAVDGVVITDMAAVGSSPTSYNFDAFVEMQATTGGSDASLATGGVTLNMVTRRGTNEWRGSARYTVALDDWQSSSDLDVSQLGAGQVAFTEGDRIVRLEAVGAEIGGPIVRDRLWIWTHYGDDEVDALTLGDVSDFTEHEDGGVKVNWKSTSVNSVVAFYNGSDLTRIGRGAGPVRPQPATWNQTGPTRISKLEDTHVFSSSFFLTGTLARVDGGFELTTPGGLDGPNPTFDEDFVWQGNFPHQDSDSTQLLAKLDGSFFFNTGGFSHEMRFGVGYRRVDLESQNLWPGSGIRLDFYPSLGAAHDVFQAARPTAADTATTYESLYLQDTMTHFGRLTVNAGARLDRQGGAVSGVSVPGVPGLESLPDGTPLLPPASAPRTDPGFDWTDFSPRLGLTYELGGARETLLKASFARFADQLGQRTTLFAAPLSASNYSYAYFFYEDENGDGRVTVDEIVDFAEGPLFTNGYDPLGQRSPNRIDPGFDAPVTDEITVGIEHAFLPEFVAGVTATFRRISGVAEEERLLIDETGTLRPHLRSDYVLARARTVQRPDGSSLEVPFFRLRHGLQDTGGFLLTNGEREQDYHGLSLSVHKRLSNRWLLRGHLTWQDWKWDVPEAEREDPNLYLGGEQDDGGPVVQSTDLRGSTKKGVFIHGRWSYSVTGLYQIAPDRRWGFSVSAALNGREGYPVPYFLGRRERFVAGPVDLQATIDADEFRLDDVHLLDLRVEKDFNWRYFTLTPALEVFNVFNESTVLERNARLGLSNADYVREIVSPRVFRLILRLSFDS